MHKDKNGIEIKEGDLLKKVGFVKYADGLKLKISKKTWAVTKDPATGELVLPTLAEGIEFLVVGNLTDGLKEEYKSIELGGVPVVSAPVGVVYRVLKRVESQNWNAGDIVKIHGKVSIETLQNGILEAYNGDKPVQHVIVVVDPIKVGVQAKQ